MRHPAQIQATIELLEQHSEKQIPIDKLMASFFKTRRYIGSKDKGIIADTAYGIFRRMGEINHILSTVGAKEEPRMQALVFCMLGNKDVKEIFAGEGYGPEKLSSEEIRIAKKDIFKILKQAPTHVKLNLPEWVCAKLEADYGKDWEALASFM